MENKGKMSIGYENAIIISIVAIIVLCVLSVVFGIMPADALPSNYLGAALGSLIGALITLVLLRGQTDIEEKKGKDVKILEKKTEVFQDFIKEVWKVWEDQKITIEEFQNLTSKYYQNLMIYLKEDRLKVIGNALSEMGRGIEKSKYDDIKKLRESIITVINELSGELELGGKVNTTIMDEHDKIVFPLIFKNSILEAANNLLPAYILEKGKYDFFREGRGKSRTSVECLCFDFRKYKGCRIVIHLTEMKLVLAIDTSYRKFDEFRCDDVYSQRIRTNNADNDLLIPLENEKNDDLGELKPIIFSDEKSMSFYREKREFAGIFANRIKYQYDETKIGNYDLLEFLEKYYEKQD